MDHEQDKQPAAAPAVAEQPSANPTSAEQPQQHLTQAVAPIASDSAFNAQPMDQQPISLPIQTALGANGSVPFTSEDMAFGMPNQGFPNGAMYPGMNMMMPTRQRPVLKE